MKQFVRKYPLFSFYVLSWVIVVAVVPLLLFGSILIKLFYAALALQFDFWSIVLAGSELLRRAPETWPGSGLALVGPLAPTLAALAVIGLAFGAKGFWALLSRYRPWRKGMAVGDALRVWFGCVLLLCALSLATAILNMRTFDAFHYTWNPNVLSWGFVGAFLVAMFLDAGALCQEGGWRGFALPILQGRKSPLASTIILGVLWALWYLPAKTDLFFAAPREALICYALFTVRLILLTMVMAYFVNRVGSALIAVTIHGLSNGAAGLQGHILFQYPIQHIQAEITQLVPLAVFTVILLVVTRGRLGYSAPSAVNTLFLPATEAKQAA